MEYQHKQEAARIAETAGATWMDADQQEQFRRICNLIDKIKSGRDFYHIINKINNNYELDVINAAREYKKCFNSAQYEQPEEAGHMEELREFYRKYGDVTEMDEVPSAGTLVAVAVDMIERDTAAEAASEGREAALGTPETMAGTDATEAAGGQQPPLQAGEINLGKLYAGTRPEAMEQDEGKQPGGP